MKLDIDPIDLRLKNYIGIGDSFWGQGPQVASVVRSDGVAELLHRGAQEIDWDNRPSPSEQDGRYRRGVGLARGFHTSSAGAAMPTDIIDYSGGMVKVNVDGSIDVITPVQDDGGGTLEAIAKIVAEALCVPLDKVEISPAGTRTTVYDCATHATRGVYAGGGAALKAANQVRQELIQTAAQFLNLMPEALTLTIDKDQKNGMIYCPSIPERRISIRDVARRCWTESRKTSLRSSASALRAVHRPMSPILSKSKWTHGPDRFVHCRPSWGLIVAQQ